MKILLFFWKNSKKRGYFHNFDVFFQMLFICILLAIDCEKIISLGSKMHPGELNHVRMVPQNVLLSSASVTNFTNHFILPMNSLGQIYRIHEVSRNLKNYFSNVMSTVRSLPMAQGKTFCKTAFLSPMPLSLMAPDKKEVAHGTRGAH